MDEFQFNMDELWFVVNELWFIVDKLWSDVVGVWFTMDEKKKEVSEGQKHVEVVSMSIVVLHSSFSCTVTPSSMVALVN